MTAVRAFLRSVLCRPAPGGWPVAESVDADALSRDFTSLFGTAPDGVWHAPGRAVLLGEHTEPSRGRTLSVALPWGVSAALARTDDGTIEVSSAQVPEATARWSSARLTDRGRGRARVPRWARGVDALLRSASPAPGAGARVRIDSDLPVGVFLGSSAAVECALFTGLADIGVLTGRPDGSAERNTVLRAEDAQAMLHDHRTARSHRVPFDLAGAGLRLLVADTGARRRAGLARRRRAEIARAERRLGPLREIEDLPGALRRLRDPVLRGRVQHVVTEIHRVNAAAGLMRAGRPAEVGALLTASHLSLRGFGLPSAETDLAVETAVRAGARGARMTGYGGTVIALTPRERVEEVTAALAVAFRGRGLEAPSVRAAVPAAGPRRIR